MRFSAVMCLKASRLFGSTPEFWMRVQADYDLKVAARNREVMELVERIVPMRVCRKWVFRGTAHEPVPS